MEKRYSKRVLHKSVVWLQMDYEQFIKLPSALELMKEVQSHWEDMLARPFLSPKTRKKLEKWHRALQNRIQELRRARIARKTQSTLKWEEDIDDDDHWTWQPETYEEYLARCAKSESVKIRPLSREKWHRLVVEGEFSLKRMLG